MFKTKSNFDSLACKWTVDSKLFHILDGGTVETVQDSDLQRAS